MRHLENARDKVLMGPERKSRLPDEEANKITAYHEGGHVLVAHYTKVGGIDYLGFLVLGANLKYSVGLKSFDYSHPKLPILGLLGWDLNTSIKDVPNLSFYKTTETINLKFLGPS